jgi:hypothetical protein
MVSNNLGEAALPFIKALYNILYIFAFFIANISEK